MDLLQLPSPLSQLNHHPGRERGIRIFIKRDDLIHPAISGNKWRKLKWNIEKAKEQRSETLITGGGPWSNHLAATAVAGKLCGFKTIGIIRGQVKRTTSTLDFCEEHGMQITFASREQFDSMPGDIESENALQLLNGYFIPLGGENEMGRRGCAEIMQEVEIDFDLVAVSVGTGTTLRGIAESIPQKRVIGFSAVRDHAQHSPEFLHWLLEHPNVELTHNYSCGGFARSTPALDNFIVSFHQQNKIMLEPVYTGKMMMGLFDMIEQEQIKNDSTIIAMHTGGLQGLKGFPDLHKRLFTS
jgi:1-aminocyclopropane-1-carboxylate deaminase